MQPIFKLCVQLNIKPIPQHPLLRSPLSLLSQQPPLLVSDYPIKVERGSRDYLLFSHQNISEVQHLTGFVHISIVMLQQDWQKMSVSNREQGYILFIHAFKVYICIQHIPNICTLFPFATILFSFPVYFLCSLMYRCNYI